MTPELITAIIGAIGLPVIVPKLIDGLRARRSGRALEEKEKNRWIVRRLAKTEAGWESEILYRRAVEEYGSTLRRLLIEDYGADAEKLPPWPVRK
jgi:hypothetical protein